MNLDAARQSKIDPNERGGSIWRSRSKSKFTNPNGAQYNMRYMQMTHFIKSLVFAFFCIGSSLQAESLTSLGQEEPQELIIYNRILAQVNSKTISVMDVVKKMDLFLHKHYPQLADSKAARHQFFSSHWKDYLRQIVETELMLIDAEKLELKVPDAEVREEILNRFGPNVMTTLDKIDLSYEEAKELIHNEMIVQRMVWLRVNSKALSQVNSQDIKAAYQSYLDKHSVTEEWDYQVLSVRSSSAELGKQTASKAYDLLKNKKSLDNVIQSLSSENTKVTLALSSDIHADNRSLSDSHREALQSLTPSSFSSPVTQLSRADGSTVHRIFYLKKHTHTPPPSFEKMAEDLKEELLQETANKENLRYLTKLKLQLGYDDKQLFETTPSDFQPFVLK